MDSKIMVRMMGFSRNDDGTIVDRFTYEIDGVAQLTCPCQHGTAIVTAELSGAGRIVPAHHVDKQTDGMYSRMVCNWIAVFLLDVLRTELDTQQLGQSFHTALTWRIMAPHNDQLDWEAFTFARGYVQSLQDFVF